MVQERRRGNLELHDKEYRVGGILSFMAGGFCALITIYLIAKHNPSFWLGVLMLFTGLVMSVAVGGALWRLQVMLRQ